jgi:hypothetical protein
MRTIMIYQSRTKKICDKFKFIFENALFLWRSRRDKFYNSPEFLLSFFKCFPQKCFLNISNQHLKEWKLSQKLYRNFKTVFFIQHKFLQSLSA